MTISDLGEVTDAALIEAVRGRDAAAEGELYVRHQAAAVRYARRLAGASDAEDLVSDAFVKVFEVIRDGRGPEVAFRPYLMTAVRNRYVDHVRKDSRHVWVGDEGVMDAVSSPGDDGMLRDESEVLASAFHSLSEHHQVVLWHALVEKDPHTVTAKLLGMTPNGVAAMTYRAKESLREAYLARHVLPTTDEDCGPTRSLLATHRQGRLPAKQRARVELHLAGCAACAGAYDELSMLDSRLAANLPAALLVVGVPTAATIAGGGAATTGAHAGTAGRGRSIAQAAAVGVAAIVAVLAAMWWADAEDGPQRVAAPPAPAPSVTPAPSVAPSVEPTVPTPTVAPPSAAVPDVPRPSPTAARPSTPQRVKPSPTGRPRPVDPVAPTATPTPGPSDLAVRALTAYSTGSGRFVLQADVVADTSSPQVTFQVSGMTSYELQGDGGRTPSCTSSGASKETTTVTCTFDGPVDGGTTMAVVVTGRRLEAVVSVAGGAGDDPRPGNNTARVAVDDSTR
jgi:RNA polymerase sigma factor (sigma-70 family)